MTEPCILKPAPCDTVSQGASPTTITMKHYIIELLGIIALATMAYAIITLTFTLH